MDDETGGCKNREDSSGHRVVHFFPKYLDKMTYYLHLHSVHIFWLGKQNIFKRVKF